VSGSAAECLQALRRGDAVGGVMRVAALAQHDGRAVMQHDRHRFTSLEATRCGSMASSQSALPSAAEIESCPHPAHSVDMPPA